MKGDDREGERRWKASSQRRDLQGSSSGDDLDELLGDDGLSGAVEGEGQLVNHLGWRRRDTNPSVNVKYKTFNVEEEII